MDCDGKLLVEKMNDLDGYRKSFHFNSLRFNPMMFWGIRLLGGVSSFKNSLATF
jgi:hypothetical protein